MQLTLRPLGVPRILAGVHKVKIIFIWVFPGGSVVKESARPIQMTQVRALVREDTTCCRAPKPLYRG